MIRKRYKRTKTSLLAESILKGWFFNKNDNLKQILIKSLYSVGILLLLCFTVCFAAVFLKTQKENSIITESRNIKSSYSVFEADRLLAKENGDYKGWIKIQGTELDNAVYQTDNNAFYMNHNGLKKKSSFGALFFDSRCDTETSQNLVIYGNTLKSGALFSSLHNLRSLNFYKKHKIINLSLNGEERDYIIYSVFILNAQRDGDNGNIYNIYRSNFSGNDEFNEWTREAALRSVIKTNVNVKANDRILTLVTQGTDFKDCRLVVMARQLRDNETMQSVNYPASVNSNPKYPKKWYVERNIPYPF